MAVYCRKHDSQWFTLSGVVHSQCPAPEGVEPEDVPCVKCVEDDLHQRILELAVKGDWQRERIAELEAEVKLLKVRLSRYAEPEHH